MPTLPLALLLAASVSGAAELRRVAYDDAGAPDAQPHLRTGSDYTFKTDSAVREAARSCVFGNTVDFAYVGLNPSANYTAKLTFYADSERTVRVKSGDRVLIESLVLPTGTVTERTVVIPGETYAKGRLTLAVEKISGANAVVSEVEILSDDPKALAPEPDEAFTIPRLSPRPASVAGCAAPALSLNGVWRFTPEAPADLTAPDTSAWKDIHVPGEWTMQGFTVKPGTPAAYSRRFALPADWTGKRVKLRCEAVYSDAVILVNGREVGRHAGGFTPFELDVTDVVKPGSDNTLTLTALNESVADKLASGSKYACHPLGGIPRALGLFALPSVNLASLRVETDLDAEYRDATLKLDLGAAFEGGAKPGKTVAVLKLTAPDGADVPLATTRVDLSTGAATVAIPVTAPAKWDPEHPRLHTLTLTLEADGKAVQTVTQRVGFREITVRGNELTVNGRPVKLRGTNRHEVYPATGRSVPKGVTRGDVALFREGNVNLIRTCHYPPDAELLEASDELGMFVEVEAPFCWAPGDGHRQLVCQQTAEMVVAYRNHPSVLMWSLANESSWGRHFAASSEFTRKLDPTRPQTFNWMTPNIQHAAEKHTDITNIHYPTRSGIPQVKGYTKHPVYFGEECHLNAYNRLELASDPGLRDRWERYIVEMWDDITAQPGALGQSIWSGIDDTFHMPNGDTVGYGTWGPIDGWRRPKPEYWGMKKAYAPVRLIGTPALPGADRTLTATIENRQYFSDLAEMAITWKTPRASGTAKAAAKPGERATLAVTLPDAPRAGERLELAFTDPRGFVAERLSLPLSPDAPKPTAKPPSAAYAESPGAITVRDGDITWRVDKATGRVTCGGKSAFEGPTLMLLALNSAGETQMTGKPKVWEPFTKPCTQWTCSGVTAKSDAGVVTVTVTGAYAEASGAYTLTFRDGTLRAAYDFAVTKAVNPRQIGLVFTLPRACETFAWERVPGFTVYDADHIARTQGRVKATEGVEATSVGPRAKPSHPWRLDNLPYGNNDFCSTKHDILGASLTDAAGDGLRVNGEGKVHVRCWRDAAASHLLVAGYSNGGSERFLRGLAARDDRPLKAGDRVTGEAVVAPAVP